MAVRVRNARKADVPALLSLTKGGAKEGSILPRTQAELLDLAGKGNLFMAEADGKVAGLVALECYSKRLAEIRTLYVSKEKRGKGAGRALLEKALQKSRKRGIGEVMVITRKGMAKWYAKGGFGKQTPNGKIALFKKGGAA